MCFCSVSLHFDDRCKPRLVRPRQVSREAQCLTLMGDWNHSLFGNSLLTHQKNNWPNGRHQYLRQKKGCSGWLPQVNADHDGLPQEGPHVSSCFFPFFFGGGACWGMKSEKGWEYQNIPCFYRISDDTSRLVWKNSCKNPWFQTFLGEFHVNVTRWRSHEFWMFLCFEIYWRKKTPSNKNERVVDDLQLRQMIWRNWPCTFARYHYPNSYTAKKNIWNPNNTFISAMIVFVSTETCTSLVT